MNVPQGPYINGTGAPPDAGRIRRPGGPLTKVDTRPGESRTRLRPGSYPGEPAIPFGSHGQTTRH